MEIKNINNFQFLFRQDSVIMNYNSNSICFHTFNVANYKQRKKNMDTFVRRIKCRQDLDIDTVYRIARTSNVDMQGSTTRISRVIM